jgi:hypothetical protein
MSAKKGAEGRLIAQKCTVNFRAMREDLSMRLVREPRKLNPPVNLSLTGGLLLGRSGRAN